MDVAISIKLLKIQWHLKARLPLQTNKIRQLGYYNEHVQVLLYSRNNT